MRQVSCQRCAVIAPLANKGGLMLCAACDLMPNCGEFQHDYGGLDEGTWVCGCCGVVLAVESATEGAAVPT